MMTNGDMLRDMLQRMTDEELATHLEAFICYKVKVCRAKDISCADCALEWLKQEVGKGEESKTDRSECASCKNL